MTEESKHLVPLNAGAQVAAIIPRTIEEVWRIAQLVTMSGMAPRDISRPEQAAVIIMHGAEVGLAPMVALQSIAVINGRPSLYGDGLLAVVRRSGTLERITESTWYGGTDGEFARCTVMRDGQRVTREFSKKQAIVAGLWGKRGRSGEPTPWITYPSRMLQMRARAFALRDVFPDVLKGLASREEMEDVAASGEAIVAPPPPSSAPMPTPLEEAIAKVKEKLSDAAIPPAETVATPPERLEAAIERTQADREIIAAKTKARKTTKATKPAVIEPPVPPPEEFLLEGAGADPSDLMVWEEGGERPASPEDIVQ